MQSEAPRPPRKRLRRWLKRLAMLLLVVAAYLGFVAVRLFWFQPELEVGPETTFVEGPLRPDGTIDYVAAINDEWSRGVTPENNATVPLMEAFGPSVISPPIRAEFFERLGIDPPPEEGDYLVPIDAFVVEQGIDDKRREELFAAVGEADAATIETDFPELAAWLKRNEKPLERIVAAGRRQQFYVPVLPVPPATTLNSIDLAMIQRCREAARLLNTAAKLGLHRGDVAAACEYALAGHRLGRLVGRHPSMIGFLVGIAIDAVAAESSQAVLLSGQLTPALARQFRQDLDALPPVADVADMIDRGERLVSLDHVQAIAKGASGTAVPTVIPGRMAQGLDKNVMLRDFNRFYDAIVAALREDDYQKRKVRLSESLTAQQSWLESKPTAVQLTWIVLTGSRSGLSRQISKVLISLLFPAVEQIQNAEDRAVMRSRLLRVAAALAEHRAVEGKFPESLEELSPEYLEAIPFDLFTDTPLTYRANDEGFVIYSVGPNEQDDGGAGPGECPECDDIRIGRGLSMKSR